MVDIKLIGVLFAVALVVVDAHQAANPLTEHNKPVQNHIHRKPITHAQQPPNMHNKESIHPHAVNTMDRNVVQNQEHIMEHLDGKIQRPEETMSEEELQFHYFKVHDYDNNNMLDGIELITALTHHHDTKGEEGSKVPDSSMSDDELSKTVDMILAENDLNQDGFIDYAEFVKTQRTANSDTV